MVNPCRWETLPCLSSRDCTASSKSPTAPAQRQAPAACRAGLHSCLAVLTGRRGDCSCTLYSTTQPQLSRQGPSPTPCRSSPTPRPSSKSLRPPTAARPPCPSPPRAPTGGRKGNVASSVAGWTDFNPNKQALQKQQCLQTAERCSQRNEGSPRAVAVWASSADQDHWWLNNMAAP